MTALVAMALAALVTGLALAVRSLVRARRHALTAAPSRPALGPYRVAGERVADEPAPRPAVDARFVEALRHVAVSTGIDMLSAINALARGRW